MAGPRVPFLLLVAGALLAATACSSSGGPADSPGAISKAPDTTAAGTADRDGAPSLNVDSVLALLDVLDAVVAANPEFAAERDSMQALPPDRQQERLAGLAAGNRDDPAVQAAIDVFLDTEARRIYLARYPNVTAADIRRCLEALPWAAAPAPGDIGRPWLAAIPIRDDLRTWVRDLAGRVDLAAARDSAAHWMPPGDYPVPEMFLVYDGNAGSYTAEGKAFYNLYSDIVRELPPGQAPGLDRLDGMQAVIAHEMQHVLAEPLFEESWPETEDWRVAARQAVVAGLVSEGVAIHCNPPTGMHREIWEDPESIAVLVAEMNGAFLALEAGDMDEEAFRSWYRGTFHDLPRRLLREHLQRRYPADQVETLLVENMPHRPDLLHALGWWMAGHVSGALPRPGDRPDAIGPADPDATRALLADPFSLPERYDAALGPDQERLRADLPPAVP